MFEKLIEGDEEAVAELVRTLGYEYAKGYLQALKDAYEYFSRED